MLRRSGRLMPEPALYTFQHQPSFARAERVEIVHQTGGEADLVHAYVFAYARFDRYNC